MTSESSPRLTQCSQITTLLELQAPPTGASIMDKAFHLAWTMHPCHSSGAILLQS